MSTIAVILPVYNVRPYLRAALDSLLAQSVRDWTAVCVDDGSTDGSGDILDEYAARDGRFRVIHQANGGVSAARNAGLDSVTEEVVTFMDPDDTVGPEWLSRLLEGVRGVDLAWGGARTVCDGRLGKDGPRDIGACYEGLALRRRVWRAIFGYRLRDLVWMAFPGGMWRHCRRELGSTCWRAFRRDVIGDLRFNTEVRLYEDSLFLAAYALRAKTMRVIGDTGYLYEIRPTGAMSTEARERLVASKFALRDARRAIDPAMTQWRGSFLLSAVEIMRSAGFRTAWRYVRNGRVRD